MEADEKKMFTVRLPLEAHRLLSHIALDRGISLSDLMVSEMVKWANAQPETTKYGTVETPSTSKRGPKTEATTTRKKGKVA